MITTSYQKYSKRGGVFSSQPPEISLFLAVLLSNFSFKYFRHSLVLNWSKFPSSEDTRPAADEWKHQFQFIFQYQWISTRSMALVSMFLCNQSYASHGRDFLLGATILNFNAPFLVAHARMFKQPKPLWSIVNEHRFIFSSSSYIGSQVCSPSWSPFQLSSVRFLLPQK